MQRWTAIVSGLVQQVGYRSRVVQIARALGITGYVANLPNGRVGIVAEGEEDVISDFAASIAIVDRFIHVDTIEARSSTATGEFSGFYKMVGEGETDTRLDKAVDALYLVVDAVNSGFENVGQIMTCMNGKLDLIADKVDQVGVKVDRVGEKVDLVAEKFDRVALKFDLVAEKVDKVATKLDTVSIKLEAVAEKIDDVGKKVEDVGTRVDGARGEIIGELCNLRSDLMNHFDSKLDRIEAGIAQGFTRTRTGKT